MSAKLISNTKQVANSEADISSNEVLDWLSRMGLGEVNPFEHLDAGADPDLSKYLVRHDVFRMIWDDSPSLVFAPAGGGKSAFRVRLTYACRVEEDRRRVFPIPYLAPEPTSSSLNDHLAPILKSAAQELLLALVYRPERFEALGEVDRRSVRRVLDQNAPGLLRHYLPQIERAGGPAPLVEAFAPSAARLPAPPDPYDVRALCTAVERMASSRDVPPVTQRFDDMLDLLLEVLDFSAVYLLVDGVDAFLETVSDPSRAVMVLEPLLEQMAAWAEERMYLKAFLPLELRSLLPERLTEEANVATIIWGREGLIDVLHARLRTASQGAFDSLDAVSAPSLRNAEEELLKVAPPVPRELLVLMNRLIEEHVRRRGSRGALEPEDLEAAKREYRCDEPGTEPFCLCRTRPKEGLMSTPPDKLPFDPAKFVDREEPLGLVLEKAGRIADGFSVERRVVIFHGERGAGKTWLLQGLEHRLHRGFSSSFVPHRVTLKEGIEVEAFESEIPRQRPLILLLDDVNEMSESLLKRLQDRVLAPLVQEDDVLIVLTERGRPHYWTAPEFREKADEFDLEPFEPDDTETQIEIQVPRAATKAPIVAARTGGYPWANYVLARYLPDEESGLERCVELFLQDVDEALWPYFRVLSILQAFDETRMRCILPVYPLFASETWNYRACRDKRKALVDTTLAEWQEGKRGYVLDDPLRLVLEALLLRRNLCQWQVLHCAAYRLYKRWSETYEQSRGWWIQEAKYHADKLKGIDYNPEDCPRGEDQEEEENDA